MNYELKQQIPCCSEFNSEFFIFEDRFLQISAQNRRILPRLQGRGKDSGEFRIDPFAAH